MKTVFIGTNPRTAEIAKLSVGLRWPDAATLEAASAPEGLAIVAQESPDLAIAHLDSPGLTPS